MDDKNYKLNLGCGIIYRPGHINIDLFDKSTADLLGDVTRLPIKPNSVLQIEAYHLIEHFDDIHTTYVLCEWFIVLKPGGTLILELPELEGSFKKYLKSKKGQRERTLKWIFGIDSNGLGHKTGFTFESLRDRLESVGFTTVTQESTTAHLYEPGLRVFCIKPKNSSHNQRFCEFRCDIINRLGITNSDDLNALEQHCFKQIHEKYLSWNDKKRLDTLYNMLSIAVICNPRIGLVLFESLKNSITINRDKIPHIERFIKELIEIDFQKRVVRLWMNYRKTLGKTDDDFSAFNDHIKSLVESGLKTEESGSDRLLYVKQLKPYPMEFFNFHTIQLKSRILFNRGVKQFHKEENHKAHSLFLESLALNPEQPLVWWNMARLESILGKAGTEIESNYQNALKTADRRDRKVLERELNSYRKKGSKSIPKSPIPDQI